MLEFRVELNSGLVCVGTDISIKMVTLSGQFQTALELNDQRNPNEPPCVILMPEVKKLCLTDRGWHNSVDHPISLLQGIDSELLAKLQQCRGGEIQTLPEGFTLHAASIEDLETEGARIGEMAYTRARPSQSSPDENVSG